MTFWAAATQDPLERLVLGLKVCENKKVSIPKWELDRRSRTQVRIAASTSICGLW